jgi:hypothetical protein
MPYTIDVFGTTYAGGVALPRYEGEHPGGSAAVPSALVELPGGNAWDSLGTDAALPRAEVITIRGEWIAASATAMQTKIDALKALTGTRNKLWTSNDSGTTTRWRYARCLQVRAAVIPGSSAYSVIEMDFELAPGLWNGAAHAETTVLDTATHNVVTTNGGNATVRNARLQINAKVATITALSVSITVSGSLITHWHYDGTIAINKYLYINCGTRRVFNENTGDDYANFALQTDHTIADWLPIYAGETTIVVSYTSADTSAHTAVLAYNDGWM